MISQKKTKVLYVCHSECLGGALISLLHLIADLDQHAYDVIVACYNRKIAGYFSERGIKTAVCYLPAFSHTTGTWYKFSIKNVWPLFKWVVNYPAYCRSLLRLLVEVKPDIVHFNSVALAPYAKVVHERKTRLIVHVREYVVAGYFGLRKKWTRHLLEKYAQEIIFICKASKESLGCTRGKILYNPVDLSKYEGTTKAQAREDLGISSDCKVVLYVGGLKKLKGAEVFAQSMKKIAEAEPEIMFLMPSFKYHAVMNPLSVLRRKIANFLGIYSIRQKIDEIITEAGLLNKVRISDFCHAIEKFFLASDVVAVPFTEPHFARAVIEAGAASVPVVASRLAGITEVVFEGENGYLFKTGDSNALADKIIACLKDAQKAAAMGQKGFQWVKQHCDAKLHAQAVSDIYDTLLLGNRQNAN